MIMFQMADVLSFSNFYYKTVFLIVHIFIKRGELPDKSIVPLAGIASLCFLYFQRQVATFKCYVFDFKVVRVPLHPN